MKKCYICHGDVESKRVSVECEWNGKNQEGHSFSARKNCADSDFRSGLQKTPSYRKWVTVALLQVHGIRG